MRWLLSPCSVRTSARPPRNRAPRRLSGSCHSASSANGTTNEISGNRTISATPSAVPASSARSEEHTSELQSLAYLVCRLLLEKKKKTDNRRCDNNDVIAGLDPYPVPHVEIAVHHLEQHVRLRVHVRSSVLHPHT